MISTNEMKKILIRFPKVELSYDKMIHKKVFADLYQAIPFGKKYFAWFSTYKNEDVCIFLETNYKLHIFDIFIKPVCFKKELSYNTILYGTILPNQKFFVIEDIFYYKNKNISSINHIQKLIYLQKMFNDDLKQVSFISNDIVFSLPLLSNSFTQLMNDIPYLPYKIYSITFLKYHKCNEKLFMKYKEKNILKAIFHIQPDIQNDIYQLFCLNHKNELEYHDITYIPNFETSVMMNKLFRNIKENNNLDALEESDDEEEFENTNVDKFVNLQKSYLMECEFNHKFKKWVPLKLLKTGEITSKKNILYFEKK